MLARLENAQASLIDTVTSEQNSDDYTVCLEQKCINYAPDSEQSYLSQQKYPEIVFERNANAELEEWALRADRKPLVLRGSRQVGKTTLVDNFSTLTLDF